MAKTLAQLVHRVRRASDQEHSSFVTDDDIRDDLNFSIAELYDLILASYSAEYFVEEHPITTVSGTSEYDLPVGFYKLAGLDLESGGNSYSVPKYNFADRNLQKNSAQFTSTEHPYRYRIYNNSLKLLPAPTGVYSLIMHYVPQFTELVLDDDVVNVSIVENWLEYAVVDVAIKVGIKEETDVRALMQQKAALGQRIVAMKENRDFANPETVRDVYAEEDAFGRYVI